MCTFLTVFLACPVGVWAAGNGGTGSGVPVWLCIPFAGLLLCVAVMPLVKGEWWESHQPVVVAFWIVLMIIPFAVVYGAGKTAETVLECVINDYLTFIILITGRTISMLAPVVPIQLESRVPSARSPTFTLGEPAKSPSTVMLPDTQNSPNNKMINVR